jgi:hypothetical protein
MKESIERLIRKNEKLKCKLGKMHRERFTTIICVALFIGVGFVVELCFDKVKEKCKGEEK